MMRQHLRLGSIAAGSVVTQKLGDAAVQGLAAAFEQILVGCVLDESVLEPINRIRRQALYEQDVRVSQPIESRL